MNELDAHSDDCNKIDAPESAYLFTKISQLPTSGNGLFSTIDIYKDEIISVFKVEVLTNLLELIPENE